MTEPLGRTQVLPYVLGLAGRGLAMAILSHEPAGTARTDLERTRQLLADAGVAWTPLVRSPSHGLGVKMWESGRAALVGMVESLRRRPRIIHARSYLPAAVADVIATTTPGAKMLFDCRGMLGDEYVDAGYWTEARLEYRLVKRFERRAFGRTDGLVVLTHALERHLLDRELVAPSTPVAVVPCCVEVERFQATTKAREDARAELGAGSRLVLVYSGTLGSWYQEREMARFAAALRRHHPDLMWLVLTRSDPGALLAAARDEGVTDVVVRSASPADMPRFLAAGDVGMSFIRPCFSKMGSSPTKVAEYLAAGMTAVVSAGIGDQDELAAERDACVVVDTSSEEDLVRAAAAASTLAARPVAARAGASLAVARARFGLAELGVPRYQALYERLLGGRTP